MWRCGWGNLEWGDRKHSVLIQGYLVNQHFHIEINSICLFPPPLNPTPKRSQSPVEHWWTFCLLGHSSVTGLCPADFTGWRENAASYMKECSLFTAGSSLLFAKKWHLCMAGAAFTGSMWWSTIVVLWPSRTGEDHQMTQCTSLFSYRDSAPSSRRRHQSLPLSQPDCPLFPG